MILEGKLSPEQLAGLLGAIVKDSSPQQTRPADVQARVLRDVREDWLAPCPFAAGDLVVVRKKGDGLGPGGWKEAGCVFLVLDVIPPDSPIAWETRNVAYRRYDMALLSMDFDGALSTIRAESRHFTRYTGEVA